VAVFTIAVSQGFPPTWQWACGATQYAKSNHAGGSAKYRYGAPGDEHQVESL